MKSNPEYDRFNETMERLLKVPHSEIKAALDEERAAKKKKRKVKKPSALGRAGRGVG